MLEVPVKMPMSFYQTANTKGPFQGYGKTDGYYFATQMKKLMNCPAQFHTIPRIAIECKTPVLLIKGINGERITIMGVIIKYKYELPFTVLGNVPKKPYIDPLKIDKLAITLAISSIKEREILDKKLKMMVAEHYQFAKSIPGGKYKNGYMIFVDDTYITHSTDRATIRVHTNPSKKTHNYIRIEFNPYKVPSFFVKEHMNNLLKDGYSRLMSNGRVTKWDEAVDIHFCELKDLYLYYPKMPCSMEYFKSGGHTKYIGKSPGPKFLRIYDKSKHIKKTNANFYYNPLNALFTKEAEPSYPILRIELSQKNNEPISIEEVKELSNEFSKLKIYNRVIPENEPTLKKEIDRMIFRQFYSNCNSDGGLQQARLLLTPDWRKKIDKIMAKNKVEWWKPDNIVLQRAAIINTLISPLKTPKNYNTFFNGLNKICNQLQ